MPNRYASKKNAQDIINWSKKEDNTSYFNGSLSMQNMQDLLRDRMGFGVAETQVIIAALVLAGAKFTIPEAEETENAE